MRSDWRRTQRRSDWRRLVLPARKPLRSLPLGDRRPFKLSKALCAAAHSDAPCLAVGGLKSSSGSYLVQVAQSLPRPDSERPTTQYACRLRGYDAPTALSWRNECASSPAAHLSRPILITIRAVSCCAVAPAEHTCLRPTQRS